MGLVEVERGKVIEAGGCIGICDPLYFHQHHLTIVKSRCKCVQYFGGLNTCKMNDIPIWLSCLCKLESIRNTLN